MIGSQSATLFFNVRRTDIKYNFHLNPLVFFFFLFLLLPFFIYFILSWLEQYIQQSTKTKSHCWRKSQRPMHDSLTFNQREVGKYLGKSITILLVSNNNNNKKLNGQIQNKKRSTTTISYIQHHVTHISSSFFFLYIYLRLPCFETVYPRLWHQNHISTLGGLLMCGLDRWIPSIPIWLVQCAVL